MSKQSKQYESMRQTQANTFSDGLNMDLHPLTTPNTILTDCVNGTMITYNDNEFVLQNERGNSKIDGAKLNPGFIPVGMKEHNGILYIVSHNPQTKESEIGTYPSPAQNYSHNESKYDANVSTELFSTYSDMNNNTLNYYDYNLTVTNYDEYILTKDDNNPLLVLENHVLDKKGKLHKIELNSDNIVHRFLHQGDGILGYKYRPYYINSFNTWITPTSGSNQAKLNLEYTNVKAPNTGIVTNRRIEKGSFVAIIGHNGSGKSTLVQHMNGLLFPTSGNVNVFDINVIRSKKITYFDSNIIRWNK